MRRFSRWFQTVMVTSAFALGLARCGVEGNPFYALSSASVTTDVPDGATLDDVPDGGDVVQGEVVLADASFVDQLDASDGNVADMVDGAISNSDAADASDVEDGAVDIVLIFPDLATPDVVTPTPDMVPVDDVVDATVAMDVIVTPDVIAAPDIVTAPDMVMVPDVVMATDVIPLMDVVDASVPLDRPDVPPAMDVVMMPDVVNVDAVDVVMMSDHPDVISRPDIVDVQVLPDFVVEYLREQGNNIVPQTGDPVTVIGVSFFSGGRWIRQDLTATRFATSPDRFRATIMTLTPEQRLSSLVALSLPVEGCGARSGMSCPLNWEYHWLVRWFGQSYTWSSSIVRGDAGSIPALQLENGSACPGQGFFNTGCVHFTTP